MAKKPLSISQEDWDEPYAPVACHPQNELAENLKDIEFKQAFVALQEAFWQTWFIRHLDCLHGY